MNLFNKNFSFNNKEKVLKEIALINEKIVNLKQKLLLDYEEHLDEIENGNLEFNFNLQQLNNEDQYLKDSTFELVKKSELSSVKEYEQSQGLDFTVDDIKAVGLDKLDNILQNDKKRKK